MIKQMTDDIFDSPKDRDAKQKSQEETVSACKLNCQFLICCTV